MISRGVKLRLSRLSSAGPMASHSWSFSGEVAGKELEPGRVIPRTSAAEDIVFAVYIYATELERIFIPPGPGSQRSGITKKENNTYPTTGPGARTGVSNSIITLFFSLFRPAIL
jgi:hypothetical protein